MVRLGCMTLYRSNQSQESAQRLVHLSAQADPNLDKFIGTVRLNVHQYVRGAGGPRIEAAIDFISSI